MTNYLRSFEEVQKGRKLQEDEVYHLLKVPKNLARYERKVNYEPMSGCWLWEAAVGIRGHGQFFLRGHKTKGLIAAHRAAWMIHRGELSPTSVICHKCDNPYCVNPDHLFVGTHKDNSMDALRKGRVVLPDTVGEANSAAILTEDDVFFIRTSGLSVKILAETLGVTKTCIHECQVGTTWAHLPGIRKSKGRGRLYTAEEDAIILDNSLTGRQKVDLTGRTSTAIYTRKNRLITPTGERRASSAGGSSNVWAKAK